MESYINGQISHIRNLTPDLQDEHRYRLDVTNQRRDENRLSW
jgi:hypothetical protein